MPHINRIRVNNVKYNFGTQFYDDFLMRFSCKNTIYDLANGGGKSVLMLLLLQNLIPNCTLDDKQPIEKLFRTNEGSTTIHSMIEWTLSDVHIKDNYKYMLTGFCARKAKEQGEGIENGERAKNGSSIEYFNYCIFYRKFNDNDIKNLPLSRNGERVTYTGLKNYLKELEKNDLSLEVKIFERKGDYQRFIAGYGLYESEWEIIRGINKTEGHVRTYFETNYKTTRKVVEDLLIEEIIEKSFRNNYLEEGSQDKLAETLLNIKDKLLELSRKKGEINNFDRQTEIMEEFQKRLGAVKQMYLGMEEAFEKLNRLHNSILEAERETTGQKEQLGNLRLKTLAEKKELGKKVETAKVLADKQLLAEMEQELTEKEEAFAEISSALEEYSDRLNLLEGGNNYLDYAEAKKEYDKLTLVLDNLLQDNAELLDRLREKVSLKKIADDARKKEIIEEVEKETQIAKNETESIEELSKELRRLDQSGAVAQHDYNRSKEALESIENQIVTLKNQTALLVPTEAAKEYDKKNLLLEENREEQKGLQEQLEESRKRELDCKLTLQEYRQEMKQLEAEKLTLEQKSAKLLNVEEKLSKLKDVYQETDIQKLGKKIEKSYRNMILRLEKEAQEVKESERILNELSAGKPIPESETLINVLEYILRVHTKRAVSGTEYLSGLEEGERICAVRNNPILPYCIIIFEHGSQILSDWELMKVAGEGNWIPILNAEGICEDESAEAGIRSEAFKRFVSENFVLNNDRVYYMAGNTDRYKKECQDAELEKQTAILKERKDSLERRLENELVVREDYLFVQQILNGFVDESLINPGKRIAELEEQIAKMTMQEDAAKEQARNLENEKETILLKITNQEQAENELLNELEILKKMTELLAQTRQHEETLKQSKQTLDTLKREYQDGTKRLAALQNMTNNRTNRIRLLQSELQSVDKEWNEKYQSYFDEGIYQMLVAENKQPKENLDTELEAIMESLMQENSSVADKEKLLNNYQISMQRSLQRIDYLGLSVQMFENMYQNKDLLPASTQELQEIKGQLEDEKKRRKEMRKQIEEKRSACDKLQGKITHSISVLEKEYGEWNAELVKNEEIKTFLNENGAILLSLDETLSELNTSIKELEENEMRIALLKKDSERLMDKTHIRVNALAGTVTAPVSEELAEAKLKWNVSWLENEYQKTAEQLDNFLQEKLKKSEEFERALSMLIDTLKMLGAEELASEMRMNVTMPLSLEEVSDLTQALQETISLIELEKQRVLKGLEDIQVIKENFENQCIQSCVNIKTELDRLSRLSKITMEDENISILKLKIPYVPEELYKDRMSEYIDRIARGTDSYEKEEDKLKYIRNNLCWKKMFSVIVTDMNAIRLNLYKRERIASQSRYLPYEEAVGSTGQSQGIYIQFLIAIINYISSINSKNADATRLRKVIFIDNPFGAAKDIYIWEPIFKLLKTNNVQLIVPARGATPAITGRFDVNYVLGQKMCNGKQQTVVVDYFSNVNHEELDYTTLSYEQTALF